MDWIILTISEYIFTFFVETASFEIVFPKGGCFVAQIIGRCYNANINKYLKEEQGYEKVSQKGESQEICFIPDNDYRNFIATHVENDSEN